MSARPAAPVKRAGLAILLSWALYDLANTIFSMNVLTRYFPEWILAHKEQGAQPHHASFTLAMAQLAVLILAPALGRWSDARARRRLLMSLCTLLCIAATLALALVQNYQLTLVIFFVSGVGYFLALAFYDSLLPAIAAPHEQGWVSGVGVGLGYAGSIVGLLLVGAVVASFPEYKFLTAYILTAALFLLFAAPCMLWVREGPPAPAAAGRAGRSFAEAWIDAVRALRRHHGLIAFYLTMFLLMNAVATVFTQMIFFIKDIGGLEDPGLTNFLVAGTVIALIASFPIGWLTDRWHPKPVFVGVIVIWVVALVLVIFAQGKTGIWLAAPFVGVGLAGAWTASRPLLLTLVPEDEAGTFFGFNALSGRFASILGLLVWSLILKVFADSGPLRYRIAVTWLLLLVIAALISVFWIPRRNPHGKRDEKS